MSNALFYTKILDSFSQSLQKLSYNSSKIELEIIASVVLGRDQGPVPNSFPALNYAMATTSILLPEPLVSPGRPSDHEPEIIIRPMLTTTPKNFQELQHCETVLKGVVPEITRQDLDVRGARCFLLHGLLTADECQHYVAETERIGYSDLSGVFPPEYRSNDRILTLSEPLVEGLWRRIEPLLSRREVIRVRPIGFGNEGTWKPFRLNECCKFGRYK